MDANSLSYPHSYGNYPQSTGLVVISLSPTDEYPTEPLYTTEPMQYVGYPDTTIEQQVPAEYSTTRHTKSILAGGEKRRRTRVSNEQLLMLERIFATDRNPTPNKRREISELLGMHERQTQIWFQNRRAKARSMELRHRELMGSSEAIAPPPESPPKLARGFEVELHNLLHEDECILIIPSSELSIGKWQRIASANAKYDLIAYGCQSRQSLTWFIHSKGHSYKMEILIESVLDAQYTAIDPDTSRATLLLSRPPDFYLERFDGKIPTGFCASSQFWKRTQDWTENREASQSLRHFLTGPTQSMHVLRSLLAAGGAEVRLNPAPAPAPAPVQVEVSPAPLSPLELPIPPMSGFSSPETKYPQHVEGLPVDTLPLPQSLSRRRRSSAADSVSSHHSPASEISFSSTDSDYSSHPTPPDYSEDMVQGVPHVADIETYYDYSTEPQVTVYDHTGYPHSQRAAEYPIAAIGNNGDLSCSSHAAITQQSMSAFQECLEAPQPTWEPYQTDGACVQQHTFHSAGPTEPFTEQTMINPAHPLQVHQGTHGSPLSAAAQFNSYPPTSSQTKCHDTMPTHPYVEMVADHASVFNFGADYPAHYVSISSHP